MATVMEYAEDLAEAIVDSQEFQDLREKEENNYEVMQERTGNKTVPQIIINDQSLGGYDDLIALENEGQFNKLIGKEVKDLI